MLFTDFIHLKQLDTKDIKNKKAFSNLMKRFLESPTLAPFLDAILRHTDIATPVNKKIQLMLLAYWEAYSKTNRGNIDAQNLYCTAIRIMEHPEDTTAIDDDEEIPPPYYMRTFNLKCQESENQIKEIIIEEGLRCLSIEHEHASRRMTEVICTEYRLPTIQEYFNYCNESASTDAKPEAQIISTQQLIGYLSVLKNFITPFLGLNSESELGKQAKKLSEFIKKVLLKIHSTTKAYLKYSEEIQALGGKTASYYEEIFTNYHDSYDFLVMSSAQLVILRAKGFLNVFPGSSNKAYVFTGDKLHFINKLQRMCVEVFNMDREKLTALKDALEFLSCEISDEAVLVAINLSSEQLALICSITKYEPENDERLPEETDARATSMRSAIVCELILRRANLKSNTIINNYIHVFNYLDTEGASGEDAHDIKACLNYWQKNLRLIALRRGVLCQLRDFKPAGQDKATKIYRKITQPEYDSLREFRCFLQGGARYGSEKWFFISGAKPGEGVNHPLLCEIELYPGAMDVIHRNKVEGQQVAICIKEAEPGCFGIHEDALPFFNQLVKKVSVTNRGGVKLAPIIFNSPQLTPDDLANLDCLFLYPHHDSKPVNFINPHEFPGRDFTTLLEQETVLPFGLIYEEVRAQFLQAMPKINAFTRNYDRRAAEATKTELLKYHFSRAPKFFSADFTQTDSQLGKWEGNQKILFSSEQLIFLKAVIARNLITNKLAELTNEALEWQHHDFYEPYTEEIEKRYIIYFLRLAKISAVCGTFDDNICFFALALVLKKRFTTSIAIIQLNSIDKNNNETEHKFLVFGGGQFVPNGDDLRTTFLLNHCHHQFVTEEENEEYGSIIVYDTYAHEIYPLTEAFTEQGARLARYHNIDQPQKPRLGCLLVIPQANIAYDNEKDISVLCEEILTVNPDPAITSQVNAKYREILIRPFMGRDINLIPFEQAFRRAAAYYDQYNSVYLKAIYTEFKIDVNGQATESKKTALHFALEKNKIDCARILIDELCANIDIADASGITPRDLINKSTDAEIRALTQPVRQTSEVPATIPTIINVSGFGHNCGLYALATRLAISGETDSHWQFLPDIVKAIHPDQAAPEADSDGLQTLGNELRVLLVSAMTADEMYKTRRIESFVALCLGAPVADMEAFQQSERGAELIAQVRSELMSFQEKIIRCYEEYIPPDTDRSTLLGGILTQLQEPLHHMNITELLSSYFKAHTSPLENLYQVCTLFKTTWDNVTEEHGSPDARQALKEKFMDWFFQKVGELMQSAPNIKDRWRYLSVLGQCYGYFTRGTLVENAKTLWTHYRVSQRWEMIYSNYLEYIATHPVMLSSDELACLARAWHINLTVRGHDEEMPLVTEFDQGVILTNPSRMHWQIWQGPENSFRTVLARESYVSDQLAIFSPRI